MSKKALVSLFALVCLNVRTKAQSETCTLYNNTITWRETVSTFEIPWRLDHVCENSIECYGSPGYGDIVQLCPLYIQLGDTVNITLPMLGFYELRPAEALLPQWRSCTDLPSTSPITARTAIFDRLSVGSTYLVQTVGADGQNYCTFGLRVNVTVQAHNCAPPTSNSSALCSNHGSCDIKSYTETAYSCSCDYSYYGEYCDEFDACTNLPCVNAGNCSDVVAGFDRNSFTCDCLQGYSGDDCSLITGSCDGVRCNNGTCFGVTLQEYRCDCFSGFEGEHCTDNIDDCIDNPCVYGVCLDQINSYQCFCFNGYTGNQCEINYDDCLLTPCMNNASCIDGVDNYTCHCLPGFSGDNCSIDINECLPVSPCENGICVDLINDFKCNCPEDGRFYTAYNCTLLTPCTDNVCWGNSTCEPSVSWDSDYTYTCNCSSGYTGDLCSIDIDECITVVCENQGNCTNLAGKFRCQCVDGYTGTYCEEDIDECLTAPCFIGSTCQDDLNGYICVCPLGMTGEHCDMAANCSDDPCQNGAACVSSKVGEIKCMCLDGYNGTYCQFEIDECSTSPCVNGICRDHVNGYSCFCQNGWRGSNCDINHDDCAEDACHNGATCVDGLSEFSCDCVLGYSGDLCQVNIDDCVNVTCANGSCVDSVNSYQCDCTDGFTGEHCELEINECLASPCSNAGICVDLVNGFTCQCAFPYSGATCDLLPCDEFPCHNQANCSNTFILPGYQCQCADGYAGRTCAENIDDCLINTDGSVPCNSRGVCVDSLRSYDCLCQPGWVGPDCEFPVNDCIVNDCRHNSTCVDDVFGYRCQCTAGWEGALCNVEINECVKIPCDNGATCIDLFNDFRCDCADGWYGDTCSLEINECAQNSSGCQNNATCIDLVNDFACSCRPFYTGPLCETFYHPCAQEYNQCLHNSTCAEFFDGSFNCSCLPGYDGRLCEVNINECSTLPCANGGSCEDLIDAYKCFCVSGYTGTWCEREIDECQPTPCSNNATCEDLIDGFRCHCTDGYTGSLCLEDSNECSVVECHNGGTCLNSVGSYECVCSPGFQGADCSVDIDECLNSTCSNGGTCVDRVASVLCQCAEGYAGPLCQTDINDCMDVDCGNGSCIDLVSDYMCACTDGYTGNTCFTNIDDCEDDTCMNGGTCQDLISSYKCHCPPGFSGARCELDDSVCAEGVCLNGATCVDGRGSAYECVCLTGFEGSQCEVNVDDCHPDSCFNGASCVDGVDDFSCLCVDGWTGTQCTLDINECNPNPCLQDGICVENYPPGGFRCLCIPGLGGEICEVNYDDCDGGRRCLNGGTCTDLLESYVCHCPEWANGTRCEHTLTASTTTTATTSTQTSTAQTLTTTITQPSTRTQTPTITTTTQLTTQTQAVTTPNTTISQTSTLKNMRSTTQAAMTSTQHTMNVTTQTFTSILPTAKTERTIKTESTAKIEPTTTVSKTSRSTTNSVSGTSIRLPVTTSPGSTFSQILSTPLQSSATAIPTTTTGSATTTASTAPTTRPTTVTASTAPTTRPTTVTASTAPTTRPTTATASTDLTTRLATTEANTTVIATSTTTWSTTKVTSSAVSLCACITCLNGGACMDTKDDGYGMSYICLCPLPYTGPRCENELTVYYPSFARSSSLTHAITPRSSVEVSLVMSVTSSGKLLTILGAGSTGSTVEISVTASGIEMIARCGGADEIRLEQMFSSPVQTVHTLQFGYFSQDETFCAASMLLDNNTATSGQRSGESIRANLMETIVLGGSGPALNSYTGCLHSMVVDGSEVGLVTEAKVGLNIDSCGMLSCSHSPCRNGAECVEDSEGWYCDCPAYYAGRYCEKRHCDINPCLHGGSCIVTDDDADFICLCVYGRHGLDCSQSLPITRPYFTGEVAGYSSFLSYPKLWGIDEGSVFQVEFVVSDESALNNSLILFSGQRGMDGRGSDYLALGLLHGHVIFMFDLGSGFGILMSLEPVHANDTLNTVTFGHNSTQGHFQVNSQQKITTKAPGVLNKMNSDTSLYIGGTDLEADTIPTEITFTGQFVGTIYSVMYRSLYDTDWRLPGYPPGQVDAGRNVQQSSLRECTVYSCNNGATCQELGASFRCVCAAGWSGMLCDEPAASTICDLNTHNCSEGSTCLPRLTHQYICLCPLGKGGDTCSEDLLISDPLFDTEESHMVLAAVDIRVDTDIVIEFKPSSYEGGLLFYSVQHMSKYSGDFLSIAITSNQYLELRLSMGHVEPLILVSPTQVIVGDWNYVRFTRHRENVTLNVNGAVVSSRASGLYTLLDLTQYFYLGGVPDLGRVNSEAIQGDPATFIGCVRKLIVNNYNYELTAEGAVSGVSVKDCDGTQCGHSVCLHGATCTPLLDNVNFTCSCTENYYGEYCGSPIICKDRCSAGARCMVYANNATYCMCPPGRLGELCAESMDISQGISFDGTADNFLMVEEIPKLPENSSENLLLSMNLTAQSDGLIMWYGKDVGMDYFGIGVTCGKLKLSWRFGYASSSEILLESSVGLIGDEWHSLTLISNSSEVKVRLDDDEYLATTPGLFTSLDPPDSLYFGSVGYRADITTTTGGLYTRPYSGCLKDIIINTQTLLDTKYRTSGIDSCSSSTTET